MPVSFTRRRCGTFFLLQLATTGLFRAKWTDEIHEEWISSVLSDRADLTKDQLERTKALMNSAVMDCLVDDYEYLIETITIPASDDRHVVAAAIHGRCDAIVTFNRKDFPSKELEKYGIEAIHPNDFISYQFDLDEAAVIISAQACRTRLKNPAKSIDEYLDTLLKQSLTKTVSALKPYKAIL